MADATAPASRSFSLQPAGEADGGDLWVALHANDFGADAVNMVRANITFDPAVVTVVSFSSADSWMEKFGYQSTFSVTKSGAMPFQIAATAAMAARPTARSVRDQRDDWSKVMVRNGAKPSKIRVDMQSTSAGGSGSGTILRLRIRKVAPGSSRLDFSDSKAYDSGYNDSLKTTHGGMLVVK